jgi:hypothetical protein
MILLDSFRKTTLELFSDSGSRWLEQLPMLIADLEQRCGFRIEQPFDLSYNNAASVSRADGGKAVLKAGHPHPELTSEMMG